MRQGEIDKGKHDPLKAFLEGALGDDIPMTFEEVEKVLGVPLPESERYATWWSKNPSNNTMTRAWLEAGFRTERVDTISSHRLVFQQATPAPAPVTLPSQSLAKPKAGGIIEALQRALGGASGLPQVSISRSPGRILGCPGQMMKPTLLDTCALIWLANNAPMRAEARSALAEAHYQGGIVVSPISAWEVGQFVAKGRLVLMAEPTIWFRKAMDSGLVLADMPPDVLITSSYLAADRLRDPADRIIAATARAYSFRLMTRDKPRLEFGAAGQLEAIAC